MQKKILFATTRNIISLGGELTFTVNRAEALLKYYDTDTVFFSFLNKNKKNNATSILKNFSIDYTSYNPKNVLGMLLSYTKFCQKVLFQIRENDYDCVILSGIFFNNIAKKIRRISNIKIVYDCHGTNDELIEFNPSIFKKILYFLLKFQQECMVSYQVPVFL